jgi:hypothetical protein
MSKHIQGLAVTTLILLALAVTAPAAEVPYVSGGVDADARAELLARQHEYNLKIVAAEKSGDYLADVKVVIDRAGRERMLDTTMEGPILLVKLPPGTYTVRATSGRDTLTQTVTIPAQGFRQALFSWAASRE